MTEAIIDEFVHRLIAAMDLQKPKKLTETLWNAEQVAEWFGLSRVTVDTRVITRPDFPKALRPVDSKQSQRRWFASDVVEWARTNTGVTPIARPGRKRKAA
jgi:predicted DNA-binding transcriptional regulator AlpA